MSSKNYNIIVATYTTQTEIEVMYEANAVTVRNIGGVALRINGILLQPPPGAGLSGEVVSFEGNDGESYRGRLSLTFLAGANPLAEVTQKFFLHD